MSLHLKDGRLWNLDADFRKWGVRIQWNEDGSVDLVQILDLTRETGETIYEKTGTRRYLERKKHRDETMWMQLFKRAVKERRYDDAELLYRNIPEAFLPSKADIWQEMQTIKGIFWPEEEVHQGQP